MTFNMAVFDKLDVRATGAIKLPCTTTARIPEKRQIPFDLSPPSKLKSKQGALGTTFLRQNRGIRSCRITTTSVRYDCYSRVRSDMRTVQAAETSPTGREGGRDPRVASSGFKMGAPDAHQT
jgi:hypothetical protein